MNKLDRAKQLQDRAKTFAIGIIHGFAALPKLEAARIIGRQFLRSGTSVAANYRAASRARSKAEFISKLGVVAEEADETLFWLDLLVDSGLVRSEAVEALRIECNELVANLREFARNGKIQSLNHSITRSLNGFLLSHRRRRCGRHRLLLRGAFTPRLQALYEKLKTIDSGRSREIAEAQAQA